MDEPENSNQQSDSAEGSAVADEAPSAIKSLHRSSTKKVFGGVCGGIAERFDVDPNIVRVIFVVLALVWGLGIAVYLAMWLIIPQTPSVPGEEAPTEEELRPRRHWLLYALLVGVVFLVVILLSTVGGFPSVGRALPLVWLAFLVVLAVVALTTPARRLTFRRFIALAFLGLLSLLILITGSFLILLQVIGVPLQGGSGVKQWSPITVAELQPRYHEAFGESTIDLVGVPFTSGTCSITATQGVGTLIVDLPLNVAVELRTHVGIGSVWPLPPRQYDAVTTGHQVPRLNLNLQVGIGVIELKRF